MFRELGSAVVAVEELRFAFANLSDDATPDNETAHSDSEGPDTISEPSLKSAPLRDTDEHTDEHENDTFPLASPHLHESPVAHMSTRA